jgi:hypothetical protein
MISLEEEAKKTGIDKKTLLEMRRIKLFIKDGIGDMAMIFFGGLGTALAASGAHYYLDKDKVNFFACSAGALLSGVIAGKGIYELGKLGFHYIRSVVRKKPELMDNYLKETYPDNLLH